MEWQKVHGHDDDTFNPETTLFICNKWDDVNDEEKNKVEKYIKSRLASTWPRLNEAPLIKISVKDITEGHPSNEGYAQYDCLLSRIYNLIRVGFHTEFMAHLRWITRFTNAVLHIIETQECFYPKNEGERTEFMEKILKQLEELGDNVQIIQHEIDKNRDSTIVRLAQSLLSYIHSEIVLKRISTWSLDDCPEVITDDPKEVYASLIRYKIQSEITLWFNNGNMASEIDALDKVIRKYFAKLEKEFQFVRRGMHTMTESVKETFVSSYTDPDTQLVLHRNRHNWIFGIVSKLGKTIANFFHRWQCNKDRLKYMQECTNKVLSEITEQRVIEVIKQDLKNIDEEIERAFDKLLEDEHKFLEELKNAPVLPGKRKGMDEIKLSCTRFLQEIEQEKQSVEYDFKDLENRKINI